MKKYGILLCIMILLFTFGCGKDKKNLEQIKIDIEDIIADNGSYDNYSSCIIDKENGKLIIELFDNSITEQKLFRENIYDSDILVFKEAPLEELADIYEIDQAYLTIKEETITNSGLMLVINDKSLSGHLFDDSNIIEKYDNDNWVIFKDKGEDVKDTNFINVRGVMEEQLSWGESYGLLASGEYRIVKSFCVDSECQTKENLYVKFVIE